jgi:hypothetical protein
LGRVINTESAAKDRTRLSKSIVLALRELMRQTEANDDSRDLAAYIGLALHEVYLSVETSVLAWEKKGYWVKADRYRMEWMWAEQTSQKILSAVQSDDWGVVAMSAATVGQKLGRVDVPIRHRLGTPWVGAWDKMAG